MVERFRAHVTDSGLLPAGDSVLVGYSGGADSTCLLQLLVLAGVEVVAAHLHHGQRPEAEEEMGRCQAFCEQLRVPFLPGRADVPAMAKSLRIGVEEAGRRARYEFFERAALEAGCAWIATAHTRDDLLETVVLNLVRGTGIRGLAGIPERRGNIVRPLLPFTRAETRAYCDERELWYHDDPANEDLEFARARVRHRVLPELRRAHPGCDESIARLALLASEEDALLDSMAAAALERCEILLNGPLRFLTLDSEAAFHRALLLHLPRPLLRRGLRLAAGALGGTLDFCQTEALAAALAEGGKGCVTGVGGTVRAEWTEETLHFTRADEVLPMRHPLSWSGETSSETFGWRFAVDEGSAGTDALEVSFDRRRVRGDLYFRTARPDDRIETGDRTKRIGDLLSAAGLSQCARRRLPVVCDLVGPVWVPGVRVSSRVEAGSDCENAVRVRFGPLFEPDRHN